MYKRFLTTVVFISTMAVVNAQTIATTSLENMIENLPKPPNILLLCMDQYGTLPMSESPDTFRNALDELNTVRESILKRFTKNCRLLVKGTWQGTVLQYLQKR